MGQMDSKQNEMNEEESKIEKQLQLIEDKMEEKRLELEKQIVDLKGEKKSEK
jgi:ABC-type phosphate transport system auxiliary subunit